MQIRTKLTIQFIILVAGLLIFSLCFIYFQFLKMTEDEFYNNLRSKALMTVEMVLHDEEKLTAIKDTPSDALSVSLPFKDNILIFNAKKEKVFSFSPYTGDLSLINFDQIDAGERRFHKGTTYFIGLKTQSKKGTFFYVVAESQFNVHQLDSLKNILLLTFLVAIGIVALGGWIYTGQALAPVAKIVEQVDKMLPSNLQTRLSTPKNKDEIGRLVMTFNSLLDRIHHAFELQKNFISNVSHELKNPISAIVSQIQVVLENKNRPIEAYKETLQSVLNDTHELAETTDNLLQLARLHTEEHQIPKFEYVRLDDILLLSREKLLRNHKEYRISFDIEGEPDSENDLCVMGNEMLLRSAFVNLMDNCCKYSPDKSTYVKVIITENHEKYVEIADHGEGIAADDIPLLFQPFYRNPKHKHIKGTGIGLSLVDSICKLHNIPLQVISKKGEGTIFRLMMNDEL